MSWLADLDPERAWQPWEPSGWSRRQAAHLARRAGFGASPRRLSAIASGTPQQAVDALFAEPDPAFERETRAMTTSVLAGNKTHALGAWWLYKMRHTPTPLREKLTLFWHGHFATSAAKVRDGRLILQQYHLLQEHAAGSFRELALGVSRDPAMLIYLDATENRKARPNENYARELMELFCLGEGNYREEDILELARCFTGWEVRQGAARFTSLHHDRGAKTVLGRTGKFDDQEAVDVVVSHPACAPFLVRKLIRFFVTDEPEIPDALVRPLAERFRAGDNLGAVVRTLLGSRLFFAAEAVGAKVKSPIDLAIGLLRTLETSGNFKQLEQAVTRLGQSPFHPPSVKGWEGGLNWINASSLLARTRLVSQMLDDKHTRPEFGEGGVEALEEALLPVPLPPSVRHDLTSLADDPARWLHALAALPEFHLA